MEAGATQNMNKHLSITATILILFCCAANLQGVTVTSQTYGASPNWIDLSSSNFWRPTSSATWKSNAQRFDSYNDSHMISAVTFNNLVKSNGSYNFTITLSSSPGYWTLSPEASQTTNHPFGVLVRIRQRVNGVDSNVPGYSGIFVDRGVGNAPVTFNITTADTPTYWVDLVLYYNHDNTGTTGCTCEAGLYWAYVQLTIKDNNNNSTAASDWFLIEGNKQANAGILTETMTVNPTATQLSVDTNGYLPATQTVGTISFSSTRSGGSSNTRMPRYRFFLSSSPSIDATAQKFELKQGPESLGIHSMRIVTTTGTAGTNNTFDGSMAAVMDITALPTATTASNWNSTFQGNIVFVRGTVEDIRTHSKGTYSSNVYVHVISGI